MEQCTISRRNLSNHLFVFWHQGQRTTDTLTPYGVCFEEMMKVIVIALLAIALNQQPQSRFFEVTHDRHPPVQHDTILAIQPDESQSAFQQLLKIGVANHIPIGMVIGAESSICRTPLALHSGQQTVEDLVTDINANLP